MSDHTSEIVKANEALRSSTPPTVPGAHAGALRPSFGVGEWRTGKNARKPRFARSAPARVRPTGGRVDPARVVVTNPREAAEIRKRERGENYTTPTDTRKGEAKAGEMNSRKKLARLTAAYLSGQCKTPETLGAIRAGYRDLGEISPV